MRMLVEIEKLSPAAKAAAMQGGIDGWGEWGSLEKHISYIEPFKSRRKCRCGCQGRVTHGLFANGVGMAFGCELKIRRLAKRFSK